MRGGATPVQMCQAFCPASPTKVFFGSNIDGAYAASGERYADSENAFAYRKALRADCTCNGRDPAGLAPVDLTLDTSLRPGDVIATTSGLVAYSGVRVGDGQTAEFTPVASYPGLTAEVRARLGEMKVAPVTAETRRERRRRCPTPRCPRPSCRKRSRHGRSGRKRIDRLRHSGAMRSIEPGISRFPMRNCASEVGPSDHPGMTQTVSEITARR